VGMVLEEDELIIEINLKEMNLEKLKEAIKRFGECEGCEAYGSLHFKLNDIVYHVQFEDQTVRIEVELECPVCGEMVQISLFNIHLLCDDRIHVDLDKIKEFIEKI